jgi:two-component system OmpR family sensor kinase
VTRLGLRGRFALLAAALVLVIASLVGAGGYLALRSSMLSHADREARGEAHRLAGLVDVGGQETETGQANQVDLADPSLIQGLTRKALRVAVARPDGRIVQATPGAPAMPAGWHARCVRTGKDAARLEHPAVTVACERMGPAARPVGTITVAGPLTDVGRTLAGLARALAIGLVAGTVLAATLARVVAQRALRPARQIAQTADSIRAGELGRRIGYRGPRDELGRLADVLDACFAEVERAVEGERRFVADASHELRTPLATIRAHVDLLRGWAGEDPAARAQALAALDQASRSAGRLVADLLYLAQLDRLPPTPMAPTCLDQVVVDAIRDTQPLRPDVAIRVTRLDEATLPGDELRLRQLLVNLLANAQRVNPAGREVSVQLVAQDGSAVVEIADEGPGIAPDQLERIFERFRTADARQAGSAGLGLAIAREIAQHHGGDVQAGNRAAGGAVFRITLPLAAVAADEAVTTHASRAP